MRGLACAWDRRGYSFVSTFLTKLEPVQARRRRRMQASGGPPDARDLWWSPPARCRIDGTRSPKTVPRGSNCSRSPVSRGSAPAWHLRKAHLQRPNPDVEERHTRRRVPARPSVTPCGAAPHPTVPPRHATPRSATHDFFAMTRCSVHTCCTKAKNDSENSSILRRWTRSARYRRHSAAARSVRTAAPLPECRSRRRGWRRRGRESACKFARAGAYLTSRRVRPSGTARRTA
jgi:hypothetical protein